MKTKLAVLLVALAAVALPLPARAADDAAAAVDAAAAPAEIHVAASGDTATLKVFNRPILVMRHTLLGMSPRERASVAHDRVNRILDRGGPGVVAVKALEQGRAITIDGEFAFAVLRGDVAASAGDSLDAVTLAATLALERAIAETRELRDGRLMVRALAYALVATVVYVLLIWALLRLGRLVVRKTLRLTMATRKRLRVGGGMVVRRHQALRIVGFAMRAAGWALFILVTYEWLGFVLGLFPYTRPWSEQLHGFLFDTTGDMLVAIAQAMPGVLIAAVVFAIARAIDSWQRGFMSGVEAGRLRVNWVDKDTAPPTRRLLSLAIWVFAVVMAYPYIPGSSSDAFKGLSVLIGIMVSVGASGIVGQAVSGLILMYTRTFRTGEFVRIGDAEGTVTRMGMFTTRVRNGMGEELLLPNSTVLGSVTRNLSRPALGSGFMVTSTVTIGYDVPWRQVEAMLVSAARATQGVFEYPPPKVYVSALSDFYVEYRLVCQVIGVDPQQRAATLSSLHTAILDAFNEHGVQIMSPHYLGDPKDAKVVPRADWFKAPAQPPKPE
ncbi:MAG: mechanosensitive ion channel [Burkholderiaceae bacterium]